MDFQNSFYSSGLATQQLPSVLCSEGIILSKIHDHIIKWNISGTVFEHSIAEQRLHRKLQISYLVVLVIATIV